MTEVEGNRRVSRLASTRMRIVLAVVALLVLVGVEIVVVLGKISSIDAAHVQDGVGSAKTAFLIGTLGVLACVVAISLWSQIEIKKRLSEISHAANSIADGDLDPDVHLLAHDFDEVGRSAAAPRRPPPCGGAGRAAGAAQRMFAELRTTADHAARVAEGDLSGELAPRS